MKCSNCGAIVSIKATTCDFCESVINTNDSEKNHNESHDYLNGVAIYESVRKLPYFFGWFDDLTYGRVSPHHYYPIGLISEDLSDEIYLEVSNHSAAWSGVIIEGILTENPEGIQFDEGVVNNYA